MLSLTNDRPVAVTILLGLMCTGELNWDVGDIRVTLDLCLYNSSRMLRIDWRSG